MTNHKAGGDDTNSRKHSARTGSAVVIFHAGVQRPLITRVRQHASSRTDE